MCELVGVLIRAIILSFMPGSQVLFDCHVMSWDNLFTHWCLCHVAVVGFGTGVMADDAVQLRW